MVFQRTMQWMLYLLLRVAICVIQALPIKTCDRLAHAVAYLAYDLLKIRRAVVTENLHHAFPNLSPAERDAIGRGMFHHVVLMVFELAHVPRKIHRSNWREHITFEASGSHNAYFLDPRPLILLSGHYGNFEVGGVISGLMGFPSHTVARPLDNPYLDHFMNRFRAMTGQFMLPKQGSAQQADTLLRSGGTLALLGDQSAGPNGCWIDFFGRPASCHKAVALFSLSYQAPLLLCYARRGSEPLQFQLGIAGSYDPVRDGLFDVRHLTQWYSSCLEDLIRSNPEQYWWMHRRWKGEPRRRGQIGRRQTASGSRHEPTDDAPPIRCRDSDQAA